MSKFGEVVDRILAKDGSDWTRDESKIIEDLIKNGEREALKGARQQIRFPEVGTMPPGSEVQVDDSLYIMTEEGLQQIKPAGALQ